MPSRGGGFGCCSCSCGQTFQPDCLLPHKDDDDDKVVVVSGAVNQVFQSIESDDTTADNDILVVALVYA
jgi:hypothetical protein